MLGNGSASFCKSSKELAHPLTSAVPVPNLVLTWPGSPASTPISTLDPESCRLAVLVPLVFTVTLGKWVQKDYYVLESSGQACVLSCVVDTCSGVSMPHSCPGAERDQFPPRRAFLSPYYQRGSRFIITIHFNDLHRFETND